MPEPSPRCYLCRHDIPSGEPAELGEGASTAGRGSTSVDGPQGAVPVAARGFASCAKRRCQEVTARDRAVAGVLVAHDGSMSGAEVRDALELACATTALRALDRLRDAELAEIIRPGRGGRAARRYRPTQVCRTELAAARDLTGDSGLDAELAPDGQTRREQTRSSGAAARAAR